MGLLRGNSKSVIAENIKEMRRRGKPEAQAVAAAMHTAKKGLKPSKSAKPKVASEYPTDEE